MPSQTHDQSSRTALFNRRSLLAAGGAGAAGAALMASAPPTAATPSPQTASDRIQIQLSVNGQVRRLSLDSRTSLLDALRDHLGLVGTKKGCDHGQCGACTVHVGGRRVLSCMTFAAAVRGPVTTIEGLAGEGGRLHPMQQAFIDQDAMQCGYCTPGQIMSAIACVDEGHAGTPADIREYMSGNLCRCAAYPNIVKAIAQARPKMRRA
jgi:xanthine dehydrogenase YagT iron-sulfur-binding subunit